MRPLLWIACLAGILAAAPPLAANSLPPEQQDQYQRLASEFVAPCCWREALTLHRSPQADQAREKLMALVRAGHTDAEIRDQFVAEHGEAVLLIPPGNQAQWLFAAPIVLTLAALALGAWFLAVALKRGRDHKPTSVRPLANIDPAELDW